VISFYYFIFCLWSKTQ